MERKRIARELHDSVGQQLGAIKYGLERCAELLQQGRPQDSLPILQRAVASLQEGMDEISSIAMNLRPAVLDDLELRRPSHVSAASSRRATRASRCARPWLWWTRIFRSVSRQSCSAACRSC